MKNIRQVIYSIFHSYLFIALLAICLGIFLPEIFREFSKYSTVFLGIIFFLSSLKIDISSLKMEIKDWKIVLLVCFFVLFATPVLVYFVP